MARSGLKLRLQEKLKLNVRSKKLKENENMIMNTSMILSTVDMIVSACLVIIERSSTNTSMFTLKYH